MGLARVIFEGFVSPLAYGIPQIRVRDSVNHNLMCQKVGLDRVIPCCAVESLL
jgi:hypothetical protein